MKILTTAIAILTLTISGAALAESGEIFRPSDDSPKGIEVVGTPSAVGCVIPSTLNGTMVVATVDKECEHNSLDAIKFRYSLDENNYCDFEINVGYMISDPMVEYIDCHGSLNYHGIKNDGFEDDEANDSWHSLYSMQFTS